MKPTVWLDLEGTIINNWHDALFSYKTSAIRNWLREQQVTEINIYSFAIHDEKDKAVFVSSGMKKSIEDALKVTINEFPCVKEVQAKVYEYEHIKYDSMYDFIQLNGKMWSFAKFCQQTDTQQHILIDDAVPNAKFTIFATHERTMQFINVVDIK